MPTQTRSGSMAFEELRTETAPELDLETLYAVHDAGHGPVIRGAHCEPAMSRLLSNVGRFVVAVTVATAPISYVDVRQEHRRSGASSMVWSLRRKRGRAISLREARQTALTILAETDRRLHEERTAEARFLLQAWDDEGMANA